MRQFAKDFLGAAGLVLVLWFAYCLGDVRGSSGDYLFNLGVSMGYTIGWGLSLALGAGVLYALGTRLK
ncbi:MAG: hypothetical protein JSS14_21795 [Proteobacteria bacterium]|nr:hypothetical protein [Pseudomonadota bacterium]